MVLILTPLLIEQEALLAALGAPAGWHCAIGGHGKVQFALTTQHLIRELKPKLVVCAGACGALDPQVKLLDIIAATETLEHDYRLKFVQRPLPAFPGDEGALKKLRAITAQFPLQPTGPFTLHTGVIASGDEDVIEDVRAGEIRSQTNALAVAWEGAGGARAARFQKTPYLELRVATDTADHQAPRDFAANVKAGMINLAAVIKTLL